MIPPLKSTSKHFNSTTLILSIWVFATITSLLIPAAVADPVILYRSFAGNYNYVVTGSTLRTSASNQCAVTANDAAPLSGVPTNASTTIRAAYLYWAGSGSTPDLTVTFEGTSISADRNFTESVGGSSPRDWFGGFKEVTNIVQSKAGGPNGNYSFANLSVDAGGNHCTVATVLSGWALVVVYEDSTTEPLRVLNIFDGLQNFWGGSISLTPNNFQIPSSGIDGKFGVLTWEGDQGNSGSRNGFNEVLRFNGTTLTDGFNPALNQYNSTINVLSATNVYGVDLDLYDVSGALSAGDTSATTFYSSGQDRVLLMMEIISVTNTPVADLSIAKSHAGNFLAGQQGTYTIGVTNNGPNQTTGTITVTDTLPGELTYVSGSGANWTCGAIDQDVTCTHPGPLANGANLPDITLTVNVESAASGTVTNTATVQGALFDNNTGDNSAADPTNIINPGPSSGTKQLYFYMTNAAGSNANTVQRTVNTTNTRSANIAAGSSYTVLLSPATQSPLTISQGNIPVSIWLRRRNGGGSRDVSVALDYFGGSNGTIGSQTLNNILNNNAWQLISFNLNSAASITLSTNTTLRLTLTHETGSSGSIRARSLRNGTRSQIALDTTTVINVESITASTDVPFPGGSVQAGYAHNTNARIRAVVSDPFGHHDISSALITITDSNNNTVVADATMTEVDPLSIIPPAATKTYEFPYTIPAGPDGTWTVLVTANEGSEGTISDLGMGTFAVGMPNITISKTVATLSNPVEGATNAHAIPGAIMQYEIVVTNTGIGPADPDSILITDLLPADLRFILNNPIAPAIFIDGDAYGQSPSGMTFTPTDVGNHAGPFNDVALSNDSGATFLPLGNIGQVGGIDSTEPKINYIRLNPKGTFSGSVGGPAPSFTIRLLLELE